MITNNKNLCQTICIKRKNEIVNLSKTTKLIFEIIYKDICDYIFELGSMQEYFGYKDMNDKTMVDCFLGWYDTITSIFYTKISNHLSITTNFNGIGKLIIPKWKDSEGGRKSSIKYHEVCDKNNPYINFTYNVVTFDNILHL